MVTIIKMSHSIRSILHYNENKTKIGAAECISASNFPLDLERLNFTFKLNRFLNRATLNTDVKRNTVHISLNFHSSENLSKEMFIKIADIYMEKIGFGSQPYLIYQHYDAGHPHLHIIASNIQRNGKRIDLHLLAIKKSEPARKEIEQLFELIKAGGRKNKEIMPLQQTVAPRAVYGKTGSMRAISNILNKVLLEYKYSDFSELNGILKQYNVMADRGKEGSKMFNSKGLLYRILDKKGDPVGVPIKASDLDLKPTLKFLEEKFQNNIVRKSFDEIRIKSMIEKVFLRTNNLAITELIRQLEREGISTVFKRSKEGLLQDITYIDYKTKNVFNGNKLGVKYGYKAIEERYTLKVLNKAKIQTTREKQKISKTLSGFQANRTLKKYRGIGS